MEVDYQIIKRYLNGNQQKGDKTKILSWFSNIQVETDLRKTYYRYWNEELLNNLNTEDYDSEKVLGKIYHEIKLEESKELARRSGLNKIINTITRVAAVLFIPLTIFLFINKDQIIQTSTEIAFSEIYSPPGTRTMFYLPDGSKGCLNGDSYLKFPAEFKGKTRKVDLKGEAFFDVKPNRKKPFIVSGKKINVVALGTSFNVEAYPKDRINKVTLVEGKVKVTRNVGKQIQNIGMLTPGQMCIYNNSTSEYHIIHVDTENIISWKEGKLIFKNEPLREVIKKLNRRYNVNIVIKDEKLKEHNYLATFVDESLDEIIRLLKLSVPIEVNYIDRERRPDGTYDKRTIELYYKPKN